MTHPLSNVLDWLRAGYPDGVPRKDFYPLLALLHRELSDAELEHIAETVIRENPSGGLSPADVHDTIGRRKDAPVTESELRAVSSHLAAAGWPLDDDPDRAHVAERAARTDHATDGTTDLEEPSPEVPIAPDGVSRVQRVLNWLSIGYPTGIPPTDRLPLLALLQRRLTDDEVEQVADRLVSRGAERYPVGRTDAGVAISHYTDSPPTEEELRRVAAELAARGWPLGSQS